jgi:hypothetical protein
MSNQLVTFLGVVMGTAACNWRYGLFFFCVGALPAITGPWWR